jgi:hypothetical protein
MASYREIVVWLAIGAATAPVWGAGFWVLWQGVVRPHLIPRVEVERLAALLVERHGERAGEVAFAREYGAWRDSSGFEQGKWRRVRRSIETRHHDAKAYSSKNDTKVRRTQ